MSLSDFLRAEPPTDADCSLADEIRLRRGVRSCGLRVVYPAANSDDSDATLAAVTVARPRRRRGGEAAAAATALAVPPLRAPAARRAGRVLSAAACAVRPTGRLSGRASGAGTVPACGRRGGFSARRRVPLSDS